MTECTCEAKDMPFGRCCKAPTLAEVTVQRDRLLELVKDAMSMIGPSLIKNTFGYEWHEQAVQAIAECECK